MRSVVVRPLVRMKNARKIIFQFNHVPKGCLVLTIYGQNEGSFFTVCSIYLGTQNLELWNYLELFRTNKLTVHLSRQHSSYKPENEYSCRWHCQLLTTQCALFARESGVTTRVQAELAH